MRQLLFVAIPVRVLRRISCVFDHTDRPSTDCAAATRGSTPEMRSLQALRRLGHR
jgi:hypothetical protein